MNLPGGVARTSILDNPLIARLLEFGLDCDEFVLFGSAPLLASGLRQEIRDLDVVARGDTWRYLAAHGLPGRGVVSGDPVAHFWGGYIQFSQRWISPDWDTDELIDNAVVIEGLRFARLSDVLAYKQALRRPKDIDDIRRISNAIESVRCDCASPAPGLDQ